MRILFLGGTIFLGRHCVEAALRRGHDVTVFHRGRHGTELFESATRILGDRENDLGQLGAGTWDGVVDTCGYVPGVVRRSAEWLSDRCDLYVFISSISAYEDLSTPGISEDAPLAKLTDPSTEIVNGETYGALKAACEREVTARYPGRSLIVRPGLIVGPWDPSDRFTYWPARIALGGQMVAPGSPNRPVQFVDVRDLAEWIVRMCEGEKAGTYNAVGPNPGISFGKLLDACQEASGSAAELVWIPDEFLVRHHVEPWSDLPLWLPAQAGYAGMDTVDASKAWKNGLTTRPVLETVSDTLRWFQTERSGVGLLAGMGRDREREILQMWESAGRAQWN